MNMVCDICMIMSYTTQSHKTTFYDFKITTFYICSDCEEILGYHLSINIQIIYMFSENISVESRDFDEKNLKIFKMLDLYLATSFDQLKSLEFPKKKIMIQKIELFVDRFYDQYIQKIQNIYYISFERAVKSCEHLLIFRDPLSSVMKGLNFN